jgi:hypothetical protein
MLADVAGRARRHEILDGVALGMMRIAADEFVSAVCGALCQQRSHDRLNVVRMPAVRQWLAAVRAPAVEHLSHGLALDLSQSHLSLHHLLSW